MQFGGPPRERELTAARTRFEVWERISGWRWSVSGKMNRSGVLNDIIECGYPQRNGRFWKEDGSGIIKEN
jgi:hypothetical protein